MRLFSYYALHTFKNQLKKLFKTWVLIFFAICLAAGIAIGLFTGFLADSSGHPDSPHQQVVVESEESTLSEPSFSETAGIETNEFIELIVGGIVLAMFVFCALSADKNGSRIFLPADVNLLFASPMKPQSVLMFRLATQLGIAVLGSVYMLFQLPNLIFNAGLGCWAALTLIAAWIFTVVFGTLIQVLLYTLSTTHTAIRRYLRPAIYGLLLTIAGIFAAFSVKCGEGCLKTAALFFNAKITRYIPLWGWIKGLCAFALEDNIPGAASCFFALVISGALLIYVIWNIRADFYEDAMAKSEETAELLEKAQSGKSAGIVFKCKKDRSDNLRRDGMRYGAGANVFFFKALYNRFRFSHLGFLTKTMEFYLAVSAGIALFCRFVSHNESILPIALTLAALSFFRSLGNPLEQDTKMDYFLLIPESTWAKLFWSLMGGTANCFLDVLPAVIAGAWIMGSNLFVSLAWVPFIVSVDFYATNVGAFIGLSVPVAAGETIKQIVQIMFIYFGLLPDIAIAALGIVSGHTIISMAGAAAFNFGLGFLFFGLSPIFIDPKGGRQNAVVFHGDIKLAKRQFSILGLGVFAILMVSAILQLAAGSIAEFVCPQKESPSWVLWLCTFAPMYLAAVPAGLLIIRRAPASPRERHSLKPGEFASAVIISISAMYMGNIAGNIILTMIQTAFQLTAENPILTYVADNSLWLRVLVMVILAPSIEEYIFRKQFIDRTNIYGEKLAVVTSAVIFGLFHGNLSQFFYAFALGLVFGYIYLKTGKLRYSTALHMLINFLGSILAPALLNSIHFESLSGILPFAIYILALIVLSLAGLVLFCVNVHKVSFHTSELELPRGMKLKTVCLNCGMILFAFVSLALIVSTFIF